MPRTKLILCSGICLLYFTALTAQTTPKNSIHLKSNSKYISFAYSKNPASSFHVDPASIRGVKRSLSVLQTPVILSTRLENATYPIPGIYWQPHMGGYAFKEKLSEFEKFQKFENKLVFNKTPVTK